MANCESLTGGITVECQQAPMGGASTIWLANWSAVTLTKGSATDSPSTEGMITAISMAPGTAFFEFRGMPNTISFEEPASINNELGSAFYKPVVKLTIPKREVAKRNKLRLLANTPLIIVVKDRIDQFHVLGSYEGMLLNELGGGIGQKAEDFNGYTLSFEGQESELSYFIDWDIFEPVIAD